MTHHLTHIGKAMTAIAAVIAFSSTPALTQETAPPSDPAPTSSTEPPATADTLAPEPAATDTAAPPAPAPKVETSRAAPARAKPVAKPVAARSAARPAARPASTAAPAPAPTATLAGPSVETAAPAMQPIAPGPMPEPAAPPTAEPALASNMPDLADELMANDLALPIAGAAALGLLALGGAGIAVHRRKRRREDEEFAARQQILDAAEAKAEAEPPLELKPTDAVGAGPAFARQAPMHDPVPARAAVSSQSPAVSSVPGPNFILRRAGQPVKDPADA